MTHYAILNESNEVIEVFEGQDYVNGLEGESYYSTFHNKTCKRTCPNTFGNHNIAGGVPFRKNFARVGMLFDPSLDAFIFPRKYNGWEFNPETGTYTVPPVPEELIGKGLIDWDNATESWVVAS
jgi:hypothetical protein